MMKYCIILVIFLLGSCPLRADESPGGDQDFINQLDSIKNPFEDGLPKPVVVHPKPVFIRPQVPLNSPQPKPAPLPKPVEVPVALPELKLQGVMVGQDIHEAIINDQIVPLNGYINDARLESVNKDGVQLIYKGKKFFLKVE